MSYGADNRRSTAEAPPVFDHTTYISPLTWRYGSPDMRRIWSEIHKRKLMRQVWLALATAQHNAGLVSAGQLEELRRNVENVNLARSLEIERETRHDVMAEIRAFAEQCPQGGAIIHWGATSADITDNADVLRIREALSLLAQRLAQLLQVLAQHVEDNADVPVMAYTHIQPAEPTTLGYRFATYAQDLLHDYLELQNLISSLRGKGLKGATGTQASFEEILRATDVSAEEMEADAMQQLSLPIYTIATQIYSRRQDLRVVQTLATIAASLHKLALDFRLLQSPAIGEWAEPFASEQVGSSAMPFKRNPINMENINSLARFVGALPAVAWENAAQSILERSLDDSANRRLFLPQSCLLVDEMLMRCGRVLEEMKWDENAMAANLARYGPFAATERVLMALVAAGANRQEAHEWLRQITLQAWEEMRLGANENPLVGLLIDDSRIGAFLTQKRLTELMDASVHVGTAPARARALAATIRSELAGPATA